MKTHLVSSALRLLVATAAIALVTIPASAADRATEQLAATGRVTVKNAGPYVEVGTFQIQVSAKLGRPTAKLADGTWLYSNYDVNDSAASGTLVVAFNQGRVSRLSLVTPTIATAMMMPAKSPAPVLLAGRN